MEKNNYVCQICNSRSLVLRYEASYVYSYVIDSDAPGLKNSDEFASYLYDKREQTDTLSYVECDKCGTKYPPNFLNGVLAQDNDSSVSIT